MVGLTSSHGIVRRLPFLYLEGRGDPSINPSSSLEQQGQGMDCEPMGQGTYT